MAEERHLKYIRTKKKWLQIYWKIQQTLKFNFSKKKCILISSLSPNQILIRKKMQKCNPIREKRKNLNVCKKEKRKVLNWEQESEKHIEAVSKIIKIIDHWKMCVFHAFRLLLLFFIYYYHQSPCGKMYFCVVVRVKLSLGVYVIFSLKML